MTPWKECKNILCIRLDNMGDMLMSAPAISAVKKTFNCKITVLTSSMAKGITAFIPAIDEVIAYDVPWVKLNHSGSAHEVFFDLIHELRSRQFDAAIIFTVFSQNPQPAALLAYLAHIPKRLGYCRENPYDLLTHWIPEKEPYTFVRHQVRRDLDLVKTIGAIPDDEKISLKLNEQNWSALEEKLRTKGISPDKPWLIMHPGVSEKKREYPPDLWAKAGTLITETLQYQILLTGSSGEKTLTDEIQDKIGKNAFSLGGMLTLEEFILLIKNAPLVISVNTSTIHIAAATGTKVIVLYALTNPQHTPWKSRGRILPFSIPSSSKSKNEVLCFLEGTYFKNEVPLPTSEEVYQIAYGILFKGDNEEIPEIVDTSTLNLDSIEEII